MLTVGKDYILNKINKNASIYLYGQELNSVTYAMAKSDMLIKGENPDFIKGGEKDQSKASTLSNDQFFLVNHLIMDYVIHLTESIGKKIETQL